MKKAILTLVVLCGIGFGASAQSVDTTKVRPADTLERLIPMITWSMANDTPPDTIAPVSLPKPRTPRVPGPYDKIFVWPASYDPAFLSRETNPDILWEEKKESQEPIEELMFNR